MDKKILDGDSGTSISMERARVRYRQETDRLKRRILSEYLMVDGRCTIHKQTAMAMLIYYGVYGELEPLKGQLKELIVEAEFHHDCGMVGLRKLYAALNKCGLEEYAYRILTAKGYPGYREWFDQGAVTLWETWNWPDHHDSKNHRMYSDCLSWMVKTLLGIRQEEGSAGFKRILGELEIPEAAEVFYRGKRFPAGKWTLWKRRDMCSM